MRKQEDIPDRLDMTKETRRSSERIRHAHMALPAAADSAAGRQGPTHGVVLPTFCLVSCLHL